MATQKNFVVKNGLNVGTVEVINSSGEITAAALGSSNTEATQDIVGAMVVGGTNITATYDDSAGSLTIDADLTGDIEGVTAGDGLTGGGSSGTPTVNVGAGTGITVNADDIEIDTSVVTDLSTAQTLTNKTLTSPVLNTGVSGTAILDEDNMASDSATQLATQQSIKAYVDAQVASKDALSELSGTSDDVTEGSSNLFHTTERVQDVVGGQLVTNGSHTNITASYDDAGDGAVDLSISDATIRGKVSVTDAGGDGSLAYDNSTGVITYTGPSASETRAHFSAGTGVTLSSGEISIGQAVATSSNVTFGNLTLSGDLTVNGTTTTIATTNTVASDTLFELGNGITGTPANDSGIIIERGSADNAFIGFDESADKFTVGTTTATGASTGDLTITTGTLVANIEGNVTGDVTGNADTATALETGRSIGLGGDLSGSASFDGTGDITITATIGANSVALGTDSTGNYVATIAGTSNEIEVSGSGSETAAVTIGLPDNVTIAGTSTLTGKATTGFTTIGSSDGALRNTFIHSAAPTSGDGAVGDVWIVYA